MFCASVKITFAFGKNSRGHCKKTNKKKEFFADKSMRMKMSQGLEEKSGGAIEHTKRRKKN